MLELGGGLSCLTALELAAGATRRDLLDGAAMTLGAWSADGRALAVSVDRDGSGRRRAVLVDSHTAAVTPLTSDDGGHDDVVCDLDAERAVLVRHHDRQHATLLLVDLTTHTASTLDGPGTLADARLLPCGVVGVRSSTGADRTGLRLHGPRGVSRVQRTDADLEAWAPWPGGGLLLSWNVDGRSRLERRGPTVRLRHPDPVVLGVTTTSTPATVVHSASATRPSTVWVGGRQLDTGADEAVAGTPRTEPRRVRLTAEDGIGFDGWWYRPAGWRRGGPAVLSFHGGPHEQERPLFNPTHQLLAAAGLAVLAPNVRGSSGRGRVFAALDVGPRRTGVWLDVDACVNWLDRAGAGRLGAFGVSYGGFPALSAAVRWPRRVRAAATLSAIVDFQTFLATATPWMAAASTVEYGHPTRDAALLRRLSPVHAVGAAGVPVLVAHGVRDHNVPVAQAHQLHDALCAHKVPTELVLFRDEAHGVHRASNKAALNRALVRWFTHYLRPIPVNNL